MAYLDAKARKTALTLLTKFGKSATYQSVTAGAYVDGEVIDTVTDYPVNAFITKPTQGEITSGVADISDAVILVAGSGLAVMPKAGDVVVFSERSYSVKRNLEVWSGDEIALHRLVGVVR
jgi:hypothetical protein